MAGGSLIGHVSSAFTPANESTLGSLFLRDIDVPASPLSMGTRLVMGYVDDGDAGVEQTRASNAMREFAHGAITDDEGATPHVVIEEGCVRMAWTAAAPIEPVGLLGGLIGGMGARSVEVPAGATVRWGDGSPAGVTVSGTEVIPTMEDETQVCGLFGEELPFGDGERRASPGELFTLCFEMGAR